MLTTSVRIFDAELNLVEGPYRTYGVMTTGDRSAKQVAMGIAHRVDDGHYVEVTTELHGDDYGVVDSTIDLYEVRRYQRIVRPYGRFNPTDSYRLPEEYEVVRA